MLIHHPPFLPFRIFILLLCFLYRDLDSHVLFSCCTEDQARSRLFSTQTLVQRGQNSSMRISTSQTHLLTSTRSHAVHSFGKYNPIINSNCAFDIRLYSAPIIIHRGTSQVAVPCSFPLEASRPKRLPNPKLLHVTHHRRILSPITPHNQVRRLRISNNIRAHNRDRRSRRGVPTLRHRTANRSIRTLGGP